jgi:rhomboid protease GluP
MSLNVRKEGIKDKIRLIGVPFFIIAAVFITLYTCCNWYVITQNIAVRENTVQLWLPFTLPWIPLLISLRPRIKLLNLKRKKGDLPTLYLIVAGFTIIAPCIIAQMYLSTATGKLTKLHFINEITRKSLRSFIRLVTILLTGNRGELITHRQLREGIIAGWTLTFTLHVLFTLLTRWRSQQR